MNVIPHILFTSLFSIIVLFLLAKLMGNRQVSQMSMFDYVNGITIGSIAAEFATSLEDDYWGTSDLIRTTAHAREMVK